MIFAIVTIFLLLAALSLRTLIVSGLKTVAFFYAFACVFFVGITPFAGIVTDAEFQLLLLQWFGNAEMVNFVSAVTLAHCLLFLLFSAAIVIFFAPKLANVILKLKFRFFVPSCLRAPKAIKAEPLRLSINRFQLVCRYNC